MTLEKLGIIRQGGIEEIVYSVEDPKLLFGLNDVPSQKRERRMIGDALLKTGLEVYSTPENWTNDLYVTSSGLVIAERDFKKLGQGGYYLFCEDFILVSEHIKGDLLGKLGDNAYLRNFFYGKQLYFVPPYDGEVYVALGNRYRPWHIDITIGYLPQDKVLSIDAVHFQQQKNLFQSISKNHELEINITKSEDGEVANYLPNNFFTFRQNGIVFAIGSKYDNSLWEKGNNVRFIPTEEDIFGLPLKNQGSIKCTINIAPTTKLWDALGIQYQRYGGSKLH